MSKMSALGIGFAGLDIIKSGKSELIMAGGTCGNVMSALASLNWKSSIIKSHYNDYWNEVADLLWKSIDVNIIECGPSTCALPRIVEVINGSDNPHYTTCPQCKRKLIDFTLPTRHKLSYLKTDLLKYDMLFYDRVADGTKYLVEHFSENGKWTLYEPNSARNYTTWVKNILSCHIVKFSSDRIPDNYCNKLIEDLNRQRHNTKIVLITHSKHGYSYSIANGNKMSEVKSVNVKDFGNVVDSSGAGDWLTAGFIDHLMQKYKTPPEIVDEHEVSAALSYGHSLAQEACNYIGALGKLFTDKNIDLPCMSFTCDFCKAID